MHKKMIYVIDAVLIAGTLALLTWAFMFTRPVLGEPVDGSVITGAVLFSFEKGDMLLIDEAPDFGSPRRIPVRDNALVTLEPGTYYWKVEGAVSSEIRTITVDSLVELKVRKSAQGYDVMNGGTTRLAVETYSQGTLTGKIILEPNEAENTEGDKFIGAQNE